MAIDISQLSSLISTVGFPIVACIYLAISNEKLRDVVAENTKTIEALKQLIFDLHNVKGG